jgi:hypothetical protein
MSPRFFKYLIIVFISFLIFPSVKLIAQDSSDVDHQVWIDYFMYRIPKEDYQFMGDAGYRFLVGGGWEKYIIRPSLQKGIKDWLNLFGGIGFFYTVQEGLSNTLEIRPWIGAKVHLFWDTFRKIKFSDYFRIEDRFVINTQSSGTSNSIRLRNKTAATIPITDHYLDDGVLYAKLSFEFFIDGGDVDELFADKIRLGGGLGYKFNYNWRVEFYFYGFESKNTTTSGFSTTDQVWQLTLKHFVD